MSETLPTFDDLAAPFYPCHPAEAHGLLCGLACGNEKVDYADWLRQLACDASEDADIQMLFEITCSQLNDVDLEFYPLLPNDKMSLSERANSLGTWCRGFISGLGCASWHQHGSLSKNAQELVEDLSKIAQVSFFTSDQTLESEERAYAEVVEYVRVGVLFIRHELRSHPTRRFLN